MESTATGYTTWLKCIIHIPPQVDQGQSQNMLVGIERFGSLVGDYLKEQDSPAIEVIDENIGI